MGKYGDAAIIATELIRSHAYVSPVDAWAAATLRMFPDKVEPRRKSCPKGAYLGLCEAGHVRGISPENYNSKSGSLNKAYALRAVRILATNPALADATASELWAAVMQGVRKKHNEQMDVVLSLKHAGLLE